MKKQKEWYPTESPEDIILARYMRVGYTMPEAQEELLRYQMEMDEEYKKQQKMKQKTE